VVVELTAPIKVRLEDPVSAGKVEAPTQQPWEQQTPVLVVVVVITKEGLMVDQVLSLFDTRPPQTQRLT
jgi:hypothetical protein